MVNATQSLIIMMTIIIPVTTTIIIYEYHSQSYRAILTSGDD